MREVLKKHAKERRATDRVGLLKDDPLAVGSDQEEESNTNLDHDIATVGGI